MVFHDGRLAFRPTFFAALAMYTYLPLGIILAALRCLAFGMLPYRVSVPLTAVTGMRSRLVAGPSPDPDAAACSREKNKLLAVGGRLYVCNHRTLLRSENGISYHILIILFWRLMTHTILGLI